MKKLDPRAQAYRYRAEIRESILRKSYGLETAGLLALDHAAAKIREEFQCFTDEEDMVSAITAHAKAGK